MAATAETDVSADLDRLLADLQAKYGHRQVHAGRLAQIEGMIANLANAVAQLPDEEAREAEFALRLLDRHDAGDFDWRTEPHDHALRLRAAIEARKAASA